MGYYTTFSLYVQEDSDVALGLAKPGDALESINQFIDSLKESDEMHWLKEAKNDNEYENGSGSIFVVNWKWYGHDIDMKKLSLLYPNVVFRLEGIGEEEDDKWHEYWRGGKKQRCQATIVIRYPEYDISQLKD